MSDSIWNSWNTSNGPRYPHEKVIQFCFRNYSPEQRKATKVLDLGCGSGVHSVFFATEGFDVTGVDISSVGITNAKKKLDKLGLNANLRVEGADILSFPNDFFDLVVCVGVYDATGYIVAECSVRNLLKVIKKGGKGIFLFASDRDFRVAEENQLGLHGYTRSEVEDLFNSAGFSTVHIDRYITTYLGGKIEQNDWLITLEK